MSAALLFMWLCCSNQVGSLAKAELLLVIPKLFRELKFELFETTREDVTLAHELFLPFPPLGSKGVRVVVVG